MSRLEKSLFLVISASAIACLLLSFSCRKADKPAGPKTKKIRLAVIPMGTTHEFWKAIHAGARKAADEAGVEIIWKGPLKEDDRNEQIQIVETMMDSGVDALILTPLDDRALMPPVAEAKARGIPTVIFNTALKGEDFIAYVSTDNWKGGVLAAERIGALMRGRGKLILIRIIEGVEGNRQREEGFLETIRTKFPGIEILSDNQYAGITTETAYQTTENLLARFHDVEAIFTPNESTTFGCLRALQDHGLAGKVIHVGFDSSKKLIEALEKRELEGLVLQDPVRMGYDSVRAAVARLRGEPYEKRIDTGVFLATPENMDQPDIRRLLVPDLSILER
ncbi:MAG: Periplasmic binding protein domain protein [Candidatus Aminicenantes bacterium]|jgi:ribose transport system substrate-binding protein|nr:Periplasmic binding protein domain protein [Candidatus Aminicenantes bacterium]